MSDNKLEKRSRSLVMQETSTTETPKKTGTRRSVAKEKSGKGQYVDKKKGKRKEIEISRIPGVRRIALSSLSQKIVNCVAGEHVTSEKPWIYVNKELILDNLELHEESSEFLPIRNEILLYPRKEMLIGLVPEEGGDLDEFYICTTEASTDAVQTLITEQQTKQEARLQNSINKVIKAWFTLGSEKEVDENIPKRNRALLEVEIESVYPILPFKIEFRFRTVEKARDGYMELTTKEENLSYVFRKIIDNETQVTPMFRNNEAQTTYTYPSNASTQYEYTIDIDEKVWLSYGKILLKYFTENIEDLLDSLYTNRNINLYLDDYKMLVSKTIINRIPFALHLSEYMSFSDVKLCRGKMITCAYWHRMITGLVAISYGNLSRNIYLKKPNTIDVVSQAIHGINPVLLWSFVDPLNPRLILETHREITTISMCPFNDNIVIGGATNGQIIVWDIKNKIQKVEEQEILTNAQTQYRSYMKSLMGWMKNIHDIKLVRATAVSDYKHSHSGAVVRIQWISPFEEVGRTGKPHQFFRDSSERSLQFMTAGEDGAVLIWDLLKKPTIGVGGFRERRLKRLKQKPAGLSTDISPFRVLHLNLKPIYKINIVHPKESRISPLSMISYNRCLVDYSSKNDGISARQSISKREIYTPLPVAPEQDFISKISVGTMEGDYGEIKWEGRDFDLGAVVNSENCEHNHFTKFHDGPVVSIAKHPSDELTLTVGGKIFAIWSVHFTGRPIFWRRCKVYLNFGSWYKFYTDRFRILRSDGLFEVWCINTTSKKAIGVTPISSADLISANVHPRVLKVPVFGLSDTLGNFRIFCSPLDVGQNGAYVIKGNTITEYFDREVLRKKNYLDWQKNWCERYVKKEEATTLIQEKKSNEAMDEEIDQGDVVDGEVDEKKSKVKFDEDEPSKKKEDRPLPGRYLEWVKEKEIAKEHERIKKMILKKKSLDTEELEKQRQPLLKLEAENEIRRKKQKARIKGSETIFKETVAMLFPAIVKEKPTPPPDPYAGGYSLEDMEKCYSQFQTISDDAERYMKNTLTQLDFSWKNVLKEGRERRRYLDNTFFKATHHERHALFKSTRNSMVVPDLVTHLTEESADHNSEDKKSNVSVHLEDSEL